SVSLAEKWHILNDNQGYRVTVPHIYLALSRHWSQSLFNFCDEGSALTFEVLGAERDGRIAFSCPPPPTPQPRQHSWLFVLGRQASVCSETLAGRRTEQRGGWHSTCVKSCGRKMQSESCQHRGRPGTVVPSQCPARRSSDEVRVTIQFNAVSSEGTKAYLRYSLLMYRFKCSGHQDLGRALKSQRGIRGTDKLETVELITKSPRSRARHFNRFFISKLESKR
ncbi:hypothetical protein DBR06_SOUSAS6210064, partial [Sousa chinensis]